MKEESANGGQISVDGPTTRAIMSHYKIDNHDELVRYMRHLGIEYND